jgi:transcription-repair coupling factor (superfamily II helicase)
LQSPPPQTSSLPPLGANAPIRYRSLYGAGAAWVISKHTEEFPHLVIVARDNEHAEELLGDLSLLHGHNTVLLYPSWDTLPFEAPTSDAEVSAQRLAVRHAIRHRKDLLIVTTAEALVQRIIRYEHIEPRIASITIGQKISVPQLSALLKHAGYHHASLVEGVGEYAQRGFVVDFYPALSEYPLRVEIHSGVITKLRSFDTVSQRTHADSESCQIIPVREWIDLSPESASYHLLQGTLSAIEKQGKLHEVPPSELQETIKNFCEQHSFRGRELYAPFSLPLVTFLEELPPRYKIALADEIGCARTIDTHAERTQERYVRLKAEHYLIPSPEQLYATASEIALQSNERIVVSLGGLDTLESITHAQATPVAVPHELLTALAVTLKTALGTGEAFKGLEDAITLWRKKKSMIACVVGSTSRAERLQRILLDLSIDAPILSKTILAWFGSGSLLAPRPPVAIFIGHLSAGVHLNADRVILISEQEIFGERSYRKSRAPKTSLKKILNSLSQLKENDYIVHADFGVGIYHGLEHKTFDGEESDFLHIEYADSKLFLPVQNIGKVQKFVGAEGQSPSLDRLGSNRWVKTKEKVKQSVLPLAADLIKLYAARSVARGWRFEPYGAEDVRFAEEFQFNETPDQLKAIEETLQDMAADRPMDRLVCGDVGFGKTEVAIRAVFKAIQHRKQVALLAPTTLLVEQHYETFLKRFNGYDISIGVLNRFHAGEENKKTLARITSGDLDLVVGTHKLLSKDVLFHDLGLVIVDEEHRFGVKQKEQLKALKKQVDVLTLTATPIPRTLHMSLLGIRDISLISTPPTSRKVVRTYVAQHDEITIRDAILRELHRSGQVFYLHNRVQSIELTTIELKALVPEARFGFAHGQMSEHELEKIMHAFINREIDVLVTTTIVESGIDIPNANTIIIDRADTYGLAQLYQLRGRVGRGDAQAYAYLLVPKMRKVTAEAQQRLEALQALDELGVGFNLALRDLEIRGAGNLLGKEQSGNVLSVGFDLYSRILKEAVLHLKGEDIALDEIIDPEVKIGINVRIPEDYIPDVAERLVLYQRLSQVRTYDELVELQREMEDRFGPIGSEVADLIDLMRFRSVLRAHGVVKAEYKGGSLLLSFSPRAPIDPEELLKLSRIKPDKYRLGKNLSLTTALPLVKSPSELYREASKILHRIARVERAQGAKSDNKSTSLGTG